MNNNFKGMDPALARTAMAKIQSKKAELDTESRSASAALKDRVSNAFAGSQTDAMDSYIERINAALEKLYTYLDGNESNFAQTFSKVIDSYDQSNENVAASFSNSTVE